MAVAVSDPRIAGIQQTYPPRSAVISWIFFAWAAEPFFTLITTFVFAPYFATHVAADPASGQSLWGFATAAAGLMIALMSPVLGAIATRSRNLGGTDSTSFNNAGLPGVNFSQDPIEYETHTHHTNLDNYERVIEEDVKASAISIAAAVYQLAMSDEILPRFKKEDMPPAPRP